MLLSPAVSAVY